MWFRIAAQLGMSVRRAQQEIDSAEFTEWLAFFELEPFGTWLTDHYFGPLLAMVANMFGKKGGKTYSVEDYLPWRNRQAVTRPSTDVTPNWQAQKAAIKAMAMAHNATLESMKRPVALKGGTKP